MSLVSPSPDESGEFPAQCTSEIRLRVAPERGLAAALRYWPGRWPEAVVLAAIAIEPYARDMEPSAWTELLDRLTIAACGVLENLARFG